ncbi:LPXTG cell wall anchor domain-containing protein [Enterococcus casseliflavus]|jgi:LPXTG-motif cell wall-anchored protein|uniref:Peptidase n=1 Tax=Enterococcus innesii TaxID=2839759 RepID=A0ABM7XP94_9ENTE|nr:LPXTG cell wall anchor domain-containing protein [Enterococcus innesii]MBF0009754.1 LPXTG cell wall anchor domain-containing protein [Enterococcus casseliflavus]MEB5950278.1 LPXTG cell wall anchor domain-containing protein [Enterococcus innesii]OQO87807.1 adhesin [Enterococcus casseliflavus]BDG66841.1 peptidase [Enterococcus innesii]
MRKLIGIVLILLLAGLLLLVFGFDHTSAKERAGGNLSFSVQTNRVIYDETLKMITVPVRPNKTLTSQKVRVLLTYGWDGNGHSEKVIGETVLTNVDWFSGVENYLRIQAEMVIDEIKSMDKVDLVVIYDGETTITENLKPSQWQVITPPSSSETTNSEISASSKVTEETGSSFSSIEPKFSDSQSMDPRTSTTENTSQDSQSIESSHNSSESESLNTQPVSESESSQITRSRETTATTGTTTVSEAASEELSDSETKPNKLAPNQSQSSKLSVSSNDPAGKQLAKASSSMKKEQEQRTKTSSAKEVNGAVLPKTGSKNTSIYYILFGLGVVILAVFLYWLNRKLFSDERQ